MLPLRPAPETAQGRADRGLLRQVSAQGMPAVPGAGGLEGQEGVGESFILFCGLCFLLVSVVFVLSPVLPACSLVAVAGGFWAMR